MALETASDLASFFDTDSHGSVATYTPSGGSASSINVIFNNEYILVDEGEVGVNSTIPVITCRTSDVSSVAMNDTFVIDSVTYKSKIIRPDGTGVTEIQLEKQ
jgi:hypothetical protein